MGGSTIWNHMTIYPSPMASISTEFTPNKIIIGQDSQISPVDFTHFQWHNSYINMTGEIRVTTQTNAVCVNNNQLLLPLLLLHPPPSAHSLI
jgi:hypothetical protein